MDLRSSLKNNIETIREEYRRIDGKWLRMQYQLMIWLVLATTVAEVVMFFILRQLQLIVAPPGLYLLKYLLTPLTCNLTLVQLAFLTMRSRRLQEETKVYTISLLLAVMAFVIYTIHSVFPALFAVFAVPMMFTIIYGDQRLTAVTALTCLVEKTVSDLFFFWDPERISVMTNSSTLADFGLSVGLLVVIYAICVFMILVEREKNEVAIKLEQERQRYQAEAMIDQLTGVWNRQALREMFTKMEQERSDKAFFLAMMGLDDFKNLNDTYGHSQGDRYLRAIGEVLLALADEQVVPFRFGGDEFCVIFSSCGAERVRGACRAIQECFARTDVNQICKPVSISIGVAEFREKEPPAQLLDRADAALYRAKEKKGSICFEELL